MPGPHSIRVGIGLLSVAVVIATTCGSATVAGQEASGERLAGDKATPAISRNAVNELTSTLPPASGAASRSGPNAASSVMAVTAPSESALDPGLTLEPGASDTVTLKANGASRHELMDALFVGHDVEIEWRNKTFAGEKVNGNFAGTPIDIARRLLDRSSYFISYDFSDDTPRILRITVLGSDPPVAGKQVALVATTPSRASRLQPAAVGQMQAGRRIISAIPEPRRHRPRR